MNHILECRYFARVPSEPRHLPVSSGKCGWTLYTVCVACPIHPPDFSHLRVYQFSSFCCLCVCSYAP
ncbi:Uncharacterized protein APZ42_026272 [Daphnia magna]|uniref:Uncharacterized protein n=1 Tax=Daphnia magna TaxID=35525 RepID=A0A164SBT1_9CRUS|nr:Uncharacterized protein APZ42_026272 [Daphnia magna]